MPDQRVLCSVYHSYAPTIRRANCYTPVAAFAIQNLSKESKMSMTPPNEPPGGPPYGGPPQMPYVQPGPDEITQTDRIWAALSYVFGILAIIALILDDTKNRKFVKYHAVQALGLWVVYFIFSMVLNFLNLAFLWRIPFMWCGVSMLLLAIWLGALYMAYLAYQGKYFQIPVITDFLASQKWIEKPRTQ
jgi:uncharacterized membrane protein